MAHVGRGKTGAGSCHRRVFKTANWGQRKPFNLRGVLKGNLCRC
jgi:hypothetical protein